MKSAAFIFTFLLLTLLACKDKDSPNPVDDLPPETQTGQQTFGCIVNGRAWVPSVPFPLNRLTVDYYQGYFAVRANLKKESKDQTISIHEFNVTKPGIYALTSYNNSSEGHFHDYNTLCTYDTDPQNIGVLEMTRVDTFNMIFAGRFHFKISAAGCDTIRVTDGRFDVKL